MKSTRPGVALVLVLWLIVVLGAVTAAAVALSRSEANSVIAYRSRAVARAAAASGVESTVALLRGELDAAPDADTRLDVLRRVRTRLEQARPRTIGSGRFAVAVEDLTGRVPINTADYVTLDRFFRFVAGDDRAPALTAAVLDWMDADDRPRPNGAEAEQYAAAGSPYRPLNRPFQRIEEVGRVLGVDAALAGALDTLVTVHGQGFVNVNTAPVAVLVAAAGLDPAAAERLVGERGGRAFANLAEVRAALGPGTRFVPVAVAPSRLQIVSRGWADGRPYTREIRAVVELSGWAEPGGPRVVVTGWEERDL